MTILLLVHVLQAVFSCALSHFHSHYLRASAPCNFHLHFTVCLPYLFHYFHRISHLYARIPRLRLFFACANFSSSLCAMCAYFRAQSPIHRISGRREKRGTKRANEYLRNKFEIDQRSCLFPHQEVHFADLTHCEILCNNFNQTEKKSAAN